ncbi:Cof-type HAD-IIB family hydrolase [Staphylococcus gallinarum]|uniref:Cof-type HAD-IIB family hydrolase n=1 Tax=Staphylococcus gallinarum TaxID=1293 RepID=UPI000D1F997E|nr:Cof-type HAD-IIB family hydrolase [Staphylococcus gallinarum]MCD8785962.1 HAD family hydrolase [Staphylococcus gallinarum]MCD8859072.1 HAD family hydrolase [Staphylococcus gallinarum]MCD8917125.1 HAD family hydrolase [Staphylococcus gallinarum]PTK91491.1 Cof-type HAD-IIB family hydrolase [Staphylococcus gallinarum]RIO89645.1 Cof-type HAD-IIB family hydrolase [Staphylococcus gallinarum]
MNLKLVVTDMDGTFLNNEGTFDRESFHLLKNQMTEKDIKFVFCTGKQCERVEALIGEHTNDVYIIGDSATKIKYNKQVLYKAAIENRLGKKIIDDLRHIDETQTIIACTDETAFVLNNLNPSELQIVRGSYHNVTLIESFEEIKDDFLKITVHDAQQKCKYTAQLLAKGYANVYIIASEDSWIDITKQGINKGTTINKIQEHLGIEISETIAFGDGLNDIDLFKAAKYKVAMDNAYPELKAQANLIAKNNDESGVIKTLQLLIND